MTDRNTSDSGRADNRPSGSEGAAPLSRRAFLGGVAAAPLLFRRSRVGRREHVVVVGAGAFGGWTALALLRGGMRVTLVDAWGAGHARASSGGETRVIRAVYGGVPLYTELAARALTLWREEERRWNRQVLVRTGALWLCASDDAFVRSSRGPMRDVGLPLQELAPGDVARRWPQISVADVRTAFFEPEAGFLTARVACELVRDTFVREGGEYRQSWARPGDAATGRLRSIALGTGGSVEADRFVFACGPWLGQVFPDVVGRRIVATRQEVFFFGTPADDSRWEAGALPAWVHMGDRVVYGLPSHERRGLKVADDSAGDEVDPTAVERVPSPAGVERARDILRTRFPALAGAPLVEARVCQYEATSDGHFLVDRHPRLENVWLAGGGSGHGFKMGPALGEHVARLVQGRAVVHPMFAHARLRERARS